ncbi:F-box associated interaction domain-containing protein [Artemisia annua]|uniref:F-box associated interaction domain-containing protein n=1 Tax=Artemisia annua TaxID=35608 RepID=A0A2U1P551_ARTAN|nr:F-box associated interaction domain-containing protein [Artemisia annua]
MGSLVDSIVGSVIDIFSFLDSSDDEDVPASFTENFHDRVTTLLRPMPDFIASQGSANPCNDIWVDHEGDHRPKKIEKPISYFPSEIILEILSRLPVKSLLRYAKDSHYSKSYPLYDVLFKKSNKLHTSFPLELISKPNLRVIGSCNGLLCILDVQTLIIYNPSTRMWSKLYKAPFGVLYGFGYDESTDDYKVVVITRGNQVNLFSLKTGTPKKIGNFPHVHLLYHSGYKALLDCGKFTNGALHWTGCNLEHESWKIISLDLAKETYGEVLQPVYDKGQKVLKLGALGHCLSVTCNYLYKGADIWVMKVYGVKDSWTKLFYIPCNLPDCGRLYQFVVPLCISNDGKVLLQYRSKLVVYDTHNSSSTEISWDFDGWNEICIVVESLVSPCAPLMRK